MRHALFTIPSILMLLMSGSRLEAQGADPRVQDAIMFYTTYCVLPKGSRNAALQSLGAGNALATRLPDAAVAKLQGGRPNGVAWAVRSPHNAQLLLEFDARGICAVRIADADEASVQRAFKAITAGIAQEAGAQLLEGPTDTRTQNGARLTSKDYVIQQGGRKMHFGLTTANRRVGDQQHLMTFALVK